MQKKKLIITSKKNKMIMKKLIIFMSVALVLLSACRQESIEARAAREAKEFTEKNCPTPPQNNSTLDSITFNQETLTFTRHFTMIGVADNAEAYVGRGGEFHQMLLNDVKNNTNIQAYKEAGFIFEFIYRSQKEKGKVLYKDLITAEEYQ